MNNVEIDESPVEAVTDPSVTSGEAPQQAEAPTVPAPERIAKLFVEMAPQKPLLIAIIDYCREERVAAEIDEMLVPLQEFRRSVYTTSTIRRLLERAGALTFISHDEAPEEQVDEDGNLVVPEKPEPTWLSTADGLAFIEAQDPFGELVRAVEPYTVHSEVFRTVIETCGDEGASISQIEAAVRAMGIMEDDKLQAGFFVGKLEDYGAIEWRGTWVATELGLQYLEHLAQSE